MNLLPKSLARTSNLPRLCCLAFLNLALLNLTAAGLSPARLTCEYLRSPLGIDTPQPRLSWKLESNARAQRQTAYQILVASSERLLDRERADLWDTGKIASGETLYLVYGGKTLGSGQVCWWKVRVWDQDGNVSRYSPPASWSMGLLTLQDRAPAKWVGATIDTNSQPAPMFRREFQVGRGLKRATVYWRR